MKFLIITMVAISNYSIQEMCQKLPKKIALVKITLTLAENGGEDFLLTTTMKLLTNFLKNDLKTQKMSSRFQLTLKLQNCTNSDDLQDIISGQFGRCFQQYMSSFAKEFKVLLSTFSTLTQKFCKKYKKVTTEELGAVIRSGGNWGEINTALGNIGKLVKNLGYCLFGGQNYKIDKSTRRIVHLVNCLAQ